MQPHKAWYSAVTAHYFCRSSRPCRKTDNGIAVMTTPAVAERPASNPPTSQRILRLYHLYRICIGILLVLLNHSQLEEQLLRVSHQQVFFYASWGYLLINLALGLGIRQPKRPSTLFSLTAIDIVLLCLLFYTAGGPPSGIGNLIVVSVAVANLFLLRHLGILLASFGAAGIIYLTFYLSIKDPAASSMYMQAGLLGTLCFAAAFFVQIASKRLKASEVLVREQAFTVASLEALNALVIERIQTGIIIIDENNQVLQANKAALSMLNSRKLQGANLGIYFRELLDSYHTWQKNPSMLPATVRFSEKSPRLQPSFVCLGQQQPSQLLIFLEDTGQVSQQAQHLKLLSLGRLAAAISHEIRNPLGAISHAAQLLNESENLDRGDLRLAQIIQDQTRRMNLVVENVLQLSRQRQSEPQVLDLKYWLHRFVSNYQNTAAANEILQLKVSGTSLQTRMDPHQLDQVLTNLISNAMRHTRPADGKRRVEIHLYRHADSQQAVLEVLDEGPGIAPAEQQSMFEPFFTTDSKGTGLGLYISRELCEANQARLDYFPRAEVGSCFMITFAHTNALGANQ